MNALLPIFSLLRKSKCSVTLVHQKILLIFMYVVLYGVDTSWIFLLTKIRILCRINIRERQIMHVSVNSCITSKWKSLF